MTTDTTTTDPPTLDVGHVQQLARDLIRELATRIDNPDAVDAELRRWLDVLDVPRMSLVSMSALRIVFASCLSHVPEVPPTEPGFTPPPEED